jgi:hypothetical protein
MERNIKHNANAVPLPPDEACNTDPARARPDLEGGEGQVANVARACQEEATVARDSQGEHVPSNPPPPHSTINHQFPPRLGIPCQPLASAP